VVLADVQKHQSPFVTTDPIFTALSCQLATLAAVIIEEGLLLYTCPILEF
jgi:hypothetical protein